MNELLGPRRQIRKFNPGTFQSDEELSRQFVVRERELGIVLEILHGNVGAPSCQHVLLVAPRGRGKTMLLARVAAELRTNREFSERLLPIRFMEESQEIFNLGDFWLETLFHLAREIGKSDPESSRELRDTHADLAARWRGKELEGHARAAALEATDRLGKQIVLMVENLQTLCEDVDDDFGWKLRKTLQSEPRIILLATATSRFTGLDDAKEPFFELFRIICLEPLDTEGCRRLWRVVSGDTISGREIRPLEILTGGNPRLLVIVAGFAQHRSLRQLMENLVSLIDDHTEYFRSHLAGFAKTERRVYLSVIDLWQPSSTGEIAARARMDVRTVSTLLGRLVNRGAVTVEGSGKKRLYVAAERLYSIYYKLRRERDEAAVVRNLILFLVVFYTDDEMTEMFVNLNSEAMQLSTIREGIERAVTEIPKIGKFFPNMVQPYPGRSKQTTIHDEVAKRFGDSDAPELREKLAIELINKGTTKGRLGEADAAIALYDEVVERFGDSDAPELRESVAKALFNKGVTRGQLGEADAEIAVYDEVVERFGDSDAPELREWVARALFNKGVTRGQLGDADAEVALYDEVVKRFGDSDAPELRESVARALFNKGVTRGQLGEAEAEIALYDEVVERFGDSDAPELQEWVAKALVIKGVTRGQLGEAEAEIALYDEVVERFGDSDAPELQEWVAKALVIKGVTRGQLGEAEAEIALYDEVVERFGDSDAPELQEQVATALVNKGLTRGQLGDADAAIAVYDEVVERFGDSDAPELQEQVAKALFNKGVTRGQLGDADAAIAVYDEVVERFGDSDAPELQEQVAMALVNKGVRRGQLGETEAEIAVYDEVVKRFGDSDAPELQEQVATALVNKGEVQIDLHRMKEALNTSKELERKYGALTDDNAITFEWRAKWIKMKVFLAQGKRSDSMEMFRSIYASFVPGNKAMVRQMLDLIAVEALERDLVDILSSDRKKSDALEPFIVALRQRIGETVRAPIEVLEIAQDIRQRIEEVEKAGGTTTSGRTK